MGRAKDIRVEPISAKDARRIIRKLHYSGITLNNSQLHLGVFLDGKCGGALQFGPSMDKRKMQGLVAGTQWNGFIELGRMALANWLPRNSESRVLSVAMRLFKKSYPSIRWVVSFADATQCGDGAIYRASGFVLTGIKKNSTIVEFPDGRRETNLVLSNLTRPKRAAIAKRYGIRLSGGSSSLAPFVEFGARPVPGYQLRYIYFLDPSARARLTVPEIPFSEIDRIGAGMYLGKPRAASIDSDAPGSQPGEGGASPTAALHLAPVLANG